MKLEQILDEPQISWLSGEGPETDVVLSSRVRLARNLEDYFFPDRASTEVQEKVLKALKSSTGDLKRAEKKDYLFLKMKELSNLDRWVLMEKHIISPQLTQGEKEQALIIREDAAVAVMVNEEDHLRIQGMARGLQIEEAFRLADRADDVLEKKQVWAYDHQLGYLTACPTNLGTGMRASVMLHLPGLGIQEKINRLSAAVQPYGMVIRGLDGEGSGGSGYIFQLSNQVTLGQSEEEIIQRLSQVAKQTVDLELKARKEFAPDYLADQAGRAYGVLKYAHQISSEEALTLASWIRLGRLAGILPAGREGWFEELLVAIRPHYLQKLQGKENITPQERDRMRAEWLRQKID